jgi:hypothetical protein
MLFSNLKILFVSLGLLLVIPGKSISPTSGGEANLSHQNSSETDISVTTVHAIGYKAVINCDDGFVAAGSGGRIDWITVSGKIIKSETIGLDNFNCLITQNNDLIVAGEHGAMFISSEKGTFRKMNSGTDKNINAIARFKGQIIAGTDDGEILSDDGEGSFSKISLAVKGNIVSLSSRNGDCFGVTDQGEILHTTDGANWDVFDFNKVYQGFYKSCAFTSILATEKDIVIAGVYEDGSPVFMTSTLGNVWSERPLVYKDQQGIEELLTDRPTGIFYDDSHDLFYLVCNGGKLMKLPSCSHCNELAEITAINLSGISGTNEMLMIVGDGFFTKPINF